MEGEAPSGGHGENTQGAHEGGVVMDEKTAKEFKALKRLVSRCEKRKKELAIRLMDRAAFMLTTLESLEKTIAEKGVISEYQNGETQWGTKKSPEVDVYNTMVKNYTAVIKQIMDIVNSGNEQKDEPDDGFEDLFGQ